jgi:hypothetical protein
MASEGSEGLRVASGGGVMRGARSEAGVAYTEIESGPGSKVIGALTRMFSLIRWLTVHSTLASHHAWAHRLL